MFGSPHPHPTTISYVEGDAFGGVFGSYCYLDEVMVLGPRVLELASLELEEERTKKTLSLSAAGDTEAC